MRLRTVRHPAVVLGTTLVLLAGCQNEAPMEMRGEGLRYGNEQPFAETELSWPIIMPSAVDGAVVFEEECASCHGVEGAAPDFTDPEWNWQRTPGQLFEAVAHGEGGHQAFDDHLSVVEVWDALAFVWRMNMPDQDVLARAALLYGNNCSVCHGKTGFGNGPLAHKLEPKPQNFTDRQVMAEFTNEYLFFRISEGGQFEEVPEGIRRTMPRPLFHAQQWSAMPAWQGVLTPEERRLIIQHLRSLTIKLQD